MPKGTTRQEAEHIEKELKSRRDKSPMVSINDTIYTLYKRFDDYITVHRSPKTAKDMKRVFIVIFMSFIYQKNDLNILPVTPKSLQISAQQKRTAD